MARTRKRGIPWEYCECGCHGSAARIGSLYFWKYDDLRGTLYLNTSHRGDTRTQIGRFVSRKDLDKAVRQVARFRSREMTREAARTASAVRQL